MSRARDEAGDRRINERGVATALALANYFKSASYPSLFIVRTKLIKVVVMYRVLDVVERYHLFDFGWTFGRFSGLVGRLSWIWTI